MSSCDGNASVVANRLPGRDVDLVDLDVEGVEFRDMEADSSPFGEKDDLWTEN